MHTHTTYTDLPASARGAVVALGNFDGDEAMARGQKSIVDRF